MHIPLSAILSRVLCLCYITIIMYICIYSSDAVEQRPECNEVVVLMSCVLTTRWGGGGGGGSPVRKSSQDNRTGFTRVLYIDQRQRHTVRSDKLLSHSHSYLCLYGTMATVVTTIARFNKVVFVIVKKKGGFYPCKFLFFLSFFLSFFSF